MRQRSEQQRDLWAMHGRIEDVRSSWHDTLQDRRMRVDVVQRLRVVLVGDHALDIEMGEITERVRVEARQPEWEVNEQRRPAVQQPDVDRDQYDLPTDCCV